MLFQDKTINTLIPDIYELVQRKDGWFHEHSDDFGREVAARTKAHFSDDRKPRLRLSQMGPRCPCALWYSIHHPELGEPLPPAAIIKYSYGHILEALAITLAKAAGHEVTGEQDELSVDGILGHRDCVIDGSIVDVKSASTRSFQKFKDGSISHDDPFGYLDQLDAYLVGSLRDPLVRNKETAYLLAIDKTLGHMVTYEHNIREQNIRKRIQECKSIVGADGPPSCTCKSIPDGKSGNLRLDVKASYNSYKYCCNPGLRTFLYASGPVYLTTVVRKPDVPEITREGRLVTR